MEEICRLTNHEATQVYELIEILKPYLAEE